MNTTGTLLVLALTFLALTAGTFAQEPSPREQFQAATAAVKKAEAALAQAKDAEARAKALDDKEALSISQQAVVIAERALGRAQKAADASVVDAQSVPSGLPKALDSAIASAYADAPPGVSDRVRKGFQAVMVRDWKVAKAWFEDALNRDPGNPGLKRLVALTDSSPQPKQPTTSADKPFTREAIPPNADKRTYAETSLKIHSQEEWRKFLFPDAARLQLPTDEDILFLFPGEPPNPTPKFTIGKDGKVIQLPEPSDSRFLFPGTTPAVESKPPSGGTPPK